MPRLIATWNGARGVWETPTPSLLCEHLAPYSQTLPVSGSMRNGSLYPPAPSAHRTGASASSSSPGLLPTPQSADAWVGDLDLSPEAVELQLHRNDPLGPRRSTTGSLAKDLAYAALLKTPTAQLAVNGGSQHPDKRRAGGHGPTLADQVEHLLPTPETGQSPNGHGIRGGRKGNGHQSGESLANIVTTLLPTPEASDGTGGRVSSELGGTRPSGSKRAIPLASAVSHLLPTPKATRPRSAESLSQHDPGQLDLF